MTTRASSESDSDDGVRITIGPVRGPIVGSAAATTDELARLDRLALDGFQADATAAAELDREVTELVRQSLQPTTTRIVVAHSRGQLLLVPEHTPISVRLATVAWGSTRPYERSTLPHQAVLQQTLAAHCVNASTYADGFPRASEPPRTIAIFGARYEPTMCANFAVVRQPSVAMAAPPPPTTSTSPLKLCRYHDFAVVIVRNGIVVDHAVHRTTSNVAECLNQHAPDRVYYNATEGDPLDVFVRYRWQPFYNALAQCSSLRPRPLSRRSAPFCSVALCGPQTRTPSALGDCLEYLWDLVTALPAPTISTRWPPPTTASSSGRPYYRTPARVWTQRARHYRRDYTTERAHRCSTRAGVDPIRKRTRSPSKERQIVNAAREHTADPSGTTNSPSSESTMNSCAASASESTVPDQSRHARTRSRSASLSSTSSAVVVSSTETSTSSSAAPSTVVPPVTVSSAASVLATPPPSRHRRGREPTRAESPPTKRRAVRDHSASSTSVSPSCRRRYTVASEVYKMPSESNTPRVTSTLLRLADASRSSVGSSLPRKRRGRRRRRPRRQLPSSIHSRLGPIPLRTARTRQQQRSPSRTRQQQRSPSRTRQQVSPVPSRTRHRPPGTRQPRSPVPARSRYSSDEDIDTRIWRYERYRQKITS